jgi:hypothetical protein
MVSVPCIVDNSNGFFLFILSLAGWLCLESIFWYFSENSGLFRFVSKQLCLFRLFR